MAGTVGTAGTAGTAGMTGTVGTAQMTTIIIHAFVTLYRLNTLAWKYFYFIFQWTP